MFKLPILLPKILFVSAALTMILRFSLNLYKNESTQAVDTKILTGHRWIGWSALCVFIIFWVGNELDNVIVETVKKAENSRELVLRMYETSGASAQAKISFGIKIASATVVNMLEENPKKIKSTARGFKLNFVPFEIHTVKVVI